MTPGYKDHLLGVLAILTWPFLSLLKGLGMVIGLFILPFVIPFSKIVPGTKRPFSDYEGWWELEILPDLFWMWSNDEDGLQGDKRGWWDAHSMFGKATNYLSKLWWVVWRNPFANASRYHPLFSCDVSKCRSWWYFGDYHVRDDVNSTGWQLVFAKSDAGRVYAGLYVVIRYGTSDHALVLQWGSKIYPRHEGVVYQEPLDYFKGHTMETQFFKNIVK